jgi:hypothetical protein
MSHNNTVVLSRRRGGRSVLAVVTAAFGLFALAAGGGAQPMPDKFSYELSTLVAATHPRPGMVLVAITHRPVYRDGTGEPAIGTLSPGAEMVVLAISKKRLRVRIDGWQQDPGARPVYARRGLRILSLALTPEAAQQVKPGPGATDPTTGLVWRSVQVTGWVDNGELVGQRDRLAKLMPELNAEGCGSCHGPKPPDTFTAYRWAGGMSSSRHRTLLDADQMGLLLHWLQMGASDKGF